MQELKERVSVLETRFENMDEQLKRLHTSLDGNTQLTLQIKERLDKQNGLIPHMSEDMKGLMKTLEHHIVADGESVKSILVKLEEKKEEDIKNSFKVKLLWGMAVAIATGMLGYVLKGFLG